MQVVGRGGAGVVRVGHAVLHQPEGGVLQLGFQLGEGVGEGLAGLVGLVLGHRRVDLGEEAHHRAAALGRQLATHEVERLHPVGPFVN